ncbi:hypothetical protein LV779_08980 [Streptomyces thinghirensis]|nr:hypothetical protein [Streptomyces thinghirensis]
MTRDASRRATRSASGSTPAFLVNDRPILGAQPTWTCSPRRSRRPRRPRRRARTGRHR